MPKKPSSSTEVDPARRAGNYLRFRLAEDLNDEAFAELLHKVGAFGLQLESPGALSAEEKLRLELDRHTRATLPRSRFSLIGKEHFWFFAEGAEQKAASMVFTALVNPRLKSGADRDQVLDPHSLGLWVRPRHETSLPPVPDGVELGKHRDDLPECRVGNRVIRVAGVLNAAEDPSRVCDLAQMGNQSIEILQLIGRNLTTHFENVRPS